MSDAPEFFMWIDKAPATGKIAFPAAQAWRSLTSQSMVRGVPIGRVTLWLWEKSGTKMAFAMARHHGQGTDREVHVELSAPPVSDANKALFVMEQERAGL